MAEKALFHAVDMKNGFQEWQYIVPAQSSSHAAALFQTNDIAVTNVTYLNWHPVQIAWNGNVIFLVSINGRDLQFESNDPGYDFLQSHFYAQVNKLIEDMRD